MNLGVGRQKTADSRKYHSSAGVHAAEDHYRSSAQQCFDRWNVRGKYSRADHEISFSWSLRGVTFDRFCSELEGALPPHDFTEPARDTLPEIKRYSGNSEVYMLHVAS